MVVKIPERKKTYEKTKNISATVFYLLMILLSLITLMSVFGIWEQVVDMITFFGPQNVTLPIPP